MQQPGPLPWFLPVLIVVGFLVIFPAFWCAVVKLISVAGGWSRLATRYPASEPALDHRWPMQSGRFGGLGNYRNVLTVGVGPEGLFLDVMALFRVGHAPLLVPWEDVEVLPDESLFFLSVTPVRIGADGTTLRLYGDVGKAVRGYREGMGAQAAG